MIHIQLIKDIILYYYVVDHKLDINGLALMEIKVLQCIYNSDFNAMYSYFLHCSSKYHYFLKLKFYSNQ